MSKLEKPLSEMSEKELRDHLAWVRKDRITSKAAVKERAKKRATAADKAENLIAGMTPEEVEQLKASLKGGA